MLAVLEATGGLPDRASECRDLFMGQIPLRSLDDFRPLSGAASQTSPQFLTHVVNRQNCHMTDNDFVADLTVIDLEFASVLARRDGSSLAFDDPGAPSSGRYTPEGFTLQLGSGSAVERNVAHLHEIHHKLLNDDTAWGIALHVLFEHPDWNVTLFPEFVRPARLVHEFFATFMSVHIAVSEAPDAASVLDRYPDYRSLYDKAEDFIAEVAGHNRRAFVITALVRVCMHSPVLDLLIERFPDSGSPSMLRSIDRPDGRFAALLFNGKRELAALVQRADRQLWDDHGVDIEEVQPNSEGLDFELIDRMWSAWESVVFDGLAGIIRDRGGTVVGHDEALLAGRRLVDLINRDGALITVPIADPNDPLLTDLEQSIAVVSTTRYPLRATLWPAQFGYLDASVSTADVIQVTVETTGLDERPELVLHARPPSRLRSGFAWDARSRERLADHENHVVVAARNIVPIDEAGGALMIFHAALDSPTHADILVEAWGDRTAALCVSVSSFTDTEFQAGWFQKLTSSLPTVVLLDVGIGSLLRNDTGALLPTNADVHTVTIGIGMPQYEALLWHVEGQQHISLHLADPLGVRLVRGQIEDAVGADHLHTDADWTPWHDTIGAVIRSLLSTESFLDLRALRDIQ